MLLHRLQLPPLRPLTPPPEPPLRPLTPPQEQKVDWVGLEAAVANFDAPRVAAASSTAAAGHHPAAKFRAGALCATTADAPCRLGNDSICIIYNRRKRARGETK